MQLLMIFARYAEQPRGYDGRKRVCKLRNHVHASALDETVDQFIDCRLDYAAKPVNAAWTECGRAEGAEPRVPRTIHEHHLLQHDFSKWCHERQAELIEIR